MKEEGGGKREIEEFNKPNSELASDVFLKCAEMRRLPKISVGT